MTGNHAEIAEKLKRLLSEASPLIDEYTHVVCPDCKDVCCRQKHGLCTEKDVLYLQALGVAVAPRDELRPLEGPCELMGPKGCRPPRWLRPFKCTWYFCAPLLAALSEGPPRKARRISALLQEMIDLYALLAPPR
jgi:hypothetical protein